MKNIIRKLPCFLLSSQAGKGMILSVFLLVGLAAWGLACVPAAGQESGQAGALGRYVEKELDLPDANAWIEDFCMTGEEGLRLLLRDGEGFAVWDSQDGGASWEKTWEAPPEENFSFIAGALSRDGRIFYGLGDEDLQQMRYFSGTIPIKTGQMSQAEEIQEIPLTLEPTDDVIANFPSQLHYMESGALLINPVLSDCLYVAEDPPKAQEMVEIDSDRNGFQYCWPVGDYVLASDGSRIRIFDPATGEETDQGRLLAEVIGENPDNLQVNLMPGCPVVCTGTKEDAYYADATGLYRVPLGGAIAEKLVDARLCALGAPDLILLGLEIQGDEFFVAARNEEGYRLLAYRYDPDMPVVPDRELVAWSLRNNDQLRQAAIQFQVQDPRYVVTVETGMEGEVTPQEAIRALHARILAGDGPDVLILDGLPLKAWLSQGLLADLSELGETVEAEDGLYEKIAGTYASDGRLCAIVTRFRIPVLETFPREGEKMTDLASFGEMTKALWEDRGGSSCLAPRKAQSLIRVMMHAFGGELGLDEGVPDPERIGLFLETLSRLLEENHYEEELREFLLEEEEEGDSFADAIVADYNVLQGSVQVCMGDLGDVYSLASLCSMDRQTGMTYRGWEGKAGLRYLPEDVLGVNAQGKDLEGAMAFAGYLLSEKGQTSNVESKFPVNRKAMEASLADKRRQSAVGSSSTYHEETGEYEEYTYEVVPLEEGEKEVFRDMVSLLEEACETDSVAEEILTREAMGYLRGDSGEEEARDEICRKLELYLAE